MAQVVKSKEPKKLQPICISMWTHDGSEKERGIVKLSWSIISAKRYEAMTPEQRKNVVSMIENFEKILQATKEELKP